MAFIFGFIYQCASLLFAVCVIILISGATGQTVNVAFEERSPILAQRGGSASLTCTVKVTVPAPVSGRPMLPLLITYTVEIDKISRGSENEGQRLTQQATVVGPATSDPNHYAVSLLTATGDTSRLSFKLAINNVSDEDVAKYRCRAALTRGSEVGRDTIDLVIPNPPSIKCMNTNVTVPATNDTVLLTCHVHHPYLTIRATLWQLTSGGDVLLSNNFTQDNVTQLMNNTHESLVSLNLKIAERREDVIGPNTIFRKQGGSNITFKVTVQTDAGDFSQNGFLTLVAPKVEPEKKDGSSTVGPSPTNAAGSERPTALVVVLITLLYLLLVRRAVWTPERD